MEENTTDDDVLIQCLKLKKREGETRYQYTNARLSM